MANHRTWMGTVNNYTDDDVTRMTNISTGNIMRMRVCKEVGESGTPHLQWMVTFVRGYTFAAVKKLMPDGAHIEPGKCMDIDVYCSKGDMIIDVNNSKQGTRLDLAKVYEAAKSKKRLRDFMEDAPTWQHIQVFQKASMVFAEPRVLPDGLDVVWYWGPTGTGKSKKAFEEPNAYVKNSTGKFWDGYDGQPTIIIDEVTEDSPYFDRATWLRITDRHPLLLEVKGATVHAQYNKVVITSNYHPREFWERMEWDLYAAFARRITEITYFPEAGSIYDLDSLDDIDAAQMAADALVDLTAE